MNDASKDGRSPPPVRRPATRVVTAGRDPKSYHGFVNPPVYHASTVIYPNAEDFPFNCAPYRTATNWQPGGPTVRFHIGLEAVEDLTADLERGFAALTAAAQIDSH
jgi:cystathionine beta-lyase/cystathionine gamma-synthase